MLPKAPCLRKLHVCAGGVQGSPPQCCPGWSRLRGSRDAARSPYPCLRVATGTLGPAEPARSACSLHATPGRPRRVAAVSLTGTEAPRSAGSRSGPLRPHAAAVPGATAANAAAALSPRRPVPAQPLRCLQGAPPAPLRRRSGSGVLPPPSLRAANLIGRAARCMQMRGRAHGSHSRGAPGGRGAATGARSAAGARRGTGRRGRLRGRAGTGGLP